MSAADQAKGPSAKAVGVATTLHAQRFDGSSVESFAEEIDAAAQPLAAALRELLDAEQSESQAIEAAVASIGDRDARPKGVAAAIERREKAANHARDALRGWGA